MEKSNNLTLLFLQQNIGLRMSKGLSPFGRWIDGKLVEAEEGRVKIEILIRKEMCNPIGNIHGGAISGIMDEIMGIAVFSLGRENFYSTVNLAINYFATSDEGQKIIVLSNVLKPGKNVINVECEIWDEEEKKLLAKGTSNLFKSNKEFSQL
jgi:acyl-coenzyme A thioesterase 13